MSIAFKLAYDFRVYGRPAPQGSKRHVGNGRMVESSQYVKPWRDAVKAAALEVRGTEPPLSEPLWVAMFFTFARPKHHYRTGRNAHLLRDNAPVAPATKPDLSKLLRSTEDALTDARVWADDALVVCYLRTSKVWATEGLDSLDAPGAVIRIYTGQAVTL
jgi:Holliday junction resolvase RusA-like endonuclease